MTKLTWLMVIISLLSACVPMQESEIVLPPVKITVVGNIETNDNIIVCNDPPEELMINVEPIGNNRIRVTLEGLEPGERPTLEIRTTIDSRSRKITVTNENIVGEDRTYVFEEYLEPIGNVNASTWILRVLHNRGAICMSLIS